MLFDTTFFTDLLLFFNLSQEINNKLGCVQLLLAAGCNKDLKNAKGKTALDRAKKQGKTDIENAIASAGGV